MGHGPCYDLGGNLLASQRRGLSSVSWLIHLKFLADKLALC